MRAAGSAPRARSWANAQVASPALAARSAPLLARNRDSDGDGACRLLGTVTMARQLTSQMLADTRQTAARSAPTPGGPAPTATSGRRAPPARMGRAAIAREPAEGPARADADPVRHRGSCPGGGNPLRTRPWDPILRVDALGAPPAVARIGATGGGCNLSPASPP